MHIYAGRHAESCVHRILRQWLGELILFYNPISLKNVMVWTALARYILIFFSHLIPPPPHI